MKKLDLKEEQAALLELLTEFDRVCRKYELRYTLAEGTLLGAVRHKGFIPWDDDVDVYMPRPDYEKFVALATQKGVLGEHYTVSKDRGNGTYYPFTKLLDTRYPLKTPNHIEVKYLFLDIFPVDGAAESAEERKKTFKKEHRWVVASGICQFYTMDRWWGFIAYIIGWWFYLLVNLFVGRKRAVRKMNEYAQKIPFEGSKMASCHNYGWPNESIPTECYEKYCELEFAGKKFMAIQDWDQFLTAAYGDYMTPPPENKRRSRHYMTIYKKD